MTDLRRLPVKEIIVVQGAAIGDDKLGELARQTGCPVVSIGPDATVESLDEEAMRRLGWVKA
jgi:hypothetical protein